MELAAGPAVVKQVVGGADADERYAREVAALELAATADEPVVPAVWGTDPGERVLVTAYVPHRRPAAGWIVAYARALAALHASGGPGVVDVLPRWRGPDDADVDSFLALADTLGARAAPGVGGELRALTRRLATAPGRALLHGNPCPGNDLHTADGVTFIDLEGASWGSGLVELAYLRVGFPTCWCVTSASPALLNRAERAYAAAWRARTGTDLRVDLADACAGWLIRGDALVERAHRGAVDQLARLPHEDWTWGTVSARERLAHRLAVVAELTGGRAESSGLAALCVELRDRMFAHWPTLRPAPTRRP